MTSTLAVYLDYRSALRALGGKNARRVMNERVDNIFSKVENSFPKPDICTLLNPDGYTEVDAAENGAYGAILVFIYKTLAESEEACMVVSSLTEEYIVGVAHSSGGLVLTSDCAMALFNAMSGAHIPVYCVDKAFAGHLKLPRTVYNNKLEICGNFIYQGKLVYAVYSESGLATTTKEGALRLTVEHARHEHTNRGIVVYSYYGGNLLSDSEFAMYLKALHLLRGTSGVVVSTDILEMSPHLRRELTNTIVLYGIVSHCLPSARVPYTLSSGLFARSKDEQAKLQL